MNDDDEVYPGICVQCGAEVDLTNTFGEVFCAKCSQEIEINLDE